MSTACKDDPCLNGGVCTEGIDDTRECKCPAMFSGQNCQSKHTFLYVKLTI